MSIVTKTGDQGTTGLMYNRRVSKCHPRVQTYGTVDELNAAFRQRDSSISRLSFPLRLLRIEEHEQNSTRLRAAINPCMVRRLLNNYIALFEMNAGVVEQHIYFAG